ncbi:TonB-dependent receptor plug domain-containing protein [Oceanicoccus sagamiensis]|uniref:TonB-dependent receptor plug domain-containing protein n=1 Tax=Oceanicoccus sagamiensis TaxID=716816 RepID=UPI00146CA4C5|nr:TonB-dependent receptor [Oceanicoccus sagamiensis]
MAASSHSFGDKHDDLFDLSLESLSEISVASLFLESEQYVGSSVSSISEKEWRQQGAEKTFEAIEHFPGIYLSEHINGMVTPSFRGHTRPDQYNSFLVLLDGIPLNNYSSASATYGTPNFALGNLERIEVIRGPGSALYGADAFHGVVSLNSWDSEQDVAELRTEFGQYGLAKISARARYGVTEDIQFTSIVSYDTVDDLEIEDTFTLGGAPVKSEITGGYDNLTTTQKLSIHDVDIAFYYSEHEVEDSWGTGEAGGFPNGHHTDGSSTMTALSASYEFPLANNWSLDSKVFYIEDELFGSFGLANVGGPPMAPTFDWDSEDKRRGIALVAKKPMDNQQTQVLFGYNYDHMEVEKFSAALQDSPPSVEGVDRELNGVMGQVDQRLFEGQLQLILGARFDHYSDFGDNFAPRLSVIYHPSRDSALKFLYGEAFRAPSVNEQIDNGIVKGGGAALDPEEVNTYEIIWMSQGKNWRYSVNTYLSEVTGTIDIGISSDPGFFLEYGNNTDSESYGIELEGMRRINNWFFSGNIAYNQTKQVEPSEIRDHNPAYPDVIANMEIKYQTDNQVTYALNHIIQNGRRTLSEPTLTPSYLNNSLSSLQRTDFYVGKEFGKAGRSFEMFLTVRDLMDNEDTKSAMNLIEVGTATAGRRINVGFEMRFE